MSEQKYVMTKKYGKAIIHVVMPPDLSDDEYKKLIYEHHAAGWAIWNSLSDAEKIKINQESNKSS